jgi:hypothetical protein
VFGDASGMQITFYGNHNGRFYCSSHSNLIGDVCGLNFDPYVERLIHNRFYPLLGNALPGDLSPYQDFKRLIPNHVARLSEGKWCVTRFFPTPNNALFEKDYDELIQTAADILSKSMSIIYKKWNRAAISLTGGCDSKTTLACTNGSYDKYAFFSYDSQKAERVDAKAAAKICAKLSIPHKIYNILYDDESYEDISDIRMLLEYNSGDIGTCNANDVRKRFEFLGMDDFDVEVKSWVSEIARAYYHKRFAKNRFPKELKPRYATSLYKVLVSDRHLVKETDKVFSNFLKKYYSDGSFGLIPWYDLFFWEFRMSSLNGLVITGEHQIAYDITIPYNNRILLQTLLSTPLEMRIKDRPHWDIMRTMNPAIAECGICVTNLKHTRLRAKLERLYLEISTKLPF